MNTQQLNKVIRSCEAAFDVFLGGPLWAILCGMALVGYIIGVTS